MINIYKVDIFATNSQQS